ncbi:unnamed protein product [Aphanomyces euteiches]|uniref:Cathepsin propeptide inhibitor domain-containing protein n=1 Tax=Aphanomyces euteiches TaxID=100861 RepID=A0A6G0XC09_9STRA|nr:hypothetical protein Ae201684_006708 [Aphanomyces euteiches]KAH9091020.1 hypothetical protein Ae201684P_006421 [Aphanomyces euteiches]KAH9141085.1 hypothetical protein AeRB84_014715 [Aphanomyces euteiches]
MKSLFFLGAATAAVLASNVDETSALRDVAAFVQYMADYDKSYRHHGDDHPLVMKRFKAFQTNLRRIEEHNRGYDAGEHTFTLGLNHLADLTDEEYKQMLGFKRSGGRSLASSTYSQDRSNDVPESWDWRKHNAVTPVKNQGQCGSCWAFSAVASMESVYALATGKLESFSEQELVDCVDGGVDDCNHGGEMSHGFVEIIDNHKGKIEKEVDYPYTAVSKGKCLAEDGKAIGHFTSYVNVTSGDEDALKGAVAQNGVVSVAIDASSFLFQLYRSGVFSWSLCKNGYDELDHGVAAVGYGNYKGKDFWLVKNSWGEGWGMDGYILMSRNKKNQCGIATDASFPVHPKQSPSLKEDAFDLNGFSWN